MVAIRQVKIPYYIGIGRKRGTGFGALAQVIGRRAIPFVRKYVVPAAERVRLDLMAFAAPEILEFVSGKKSFKSASQSVGRQTLKKKPLVFGSNQKKVMHTKGTMQASRSRKTSSQVFIVNHVN